MREEVFNVVQDKEAEAFDRFVDTVEPGSEAFQDKGKGSTLNEIKKMLLAFEVVVEARKGYSGGAADFAHGGALETVLGKDLRGSAEDVLELGLGVACDRDGGSHRRLERSFDKCSSRGYACQVGFGICVRLALRGVFQGGFEIEVGNKPMEIVGMKTEQLSGLGEAALGLLKGSEDEMFLGVAY
jgi:hypothetical protein